MGAIVYKSSIKAAVLNIVMTLNHPTKDTKSLKVKKKNEEWGIFPFPSV